MARGQGRASPVVVDELFRVLLRFPITDYGNHGEQSPGVGQWGRQPELHEAGCFQECYYGYNLCFSGGEDPEVCADHFEMCKDSCP